jgi:hypothetical protein
MSALLTTKMSAISMIPALMICTESPAAGVVTTTVVSAVCITSSSDWPTPTVSSRQRSRPLASIRQAAEVSARGHGADVDAAVERVALHAHPVAEDGAAAERARRVDRDDAHGVARLAPALDDAVTEGALAAAGRARDAHHVRPARPAAHLAEQVLDGGVVVLDHADGAGEGADVAVEQALGEFHLGRV